MVMLLRTASAVNPRRSCAAYRTARTGNAARANVTPMRLTGRLWKLRAWSMTVTLPTAMVDARFVKKMNSSGSSGPLAALGSSRRKNSRIAAVRRCRRGHGRNVVREMPIEPDAEVHRRPEDRADRRREDADLVDQQHRPDDDPEVVEQRRRAVEEESPLGDEDLAERHRAREQHLGEAHDPEQLDVELPRLRRRTRTRPSRPSAGRR